MEITRPVRKRMEGKIFIFRQSWHFLFVDDILKKLFPNLHLHLVCVNNYVSRQGKGINRRIESTQNTIVIANIVIIGDHFLFVSYNYLTANKLISSIKKHSSVLIAVHYFSRRKRQLWEMGKNLQSLTKKIESNIRGVTWHKSQKSPDHKSTIFPKFLRKSEVDIKSCLKNIAGQIAAF